MLNIVICDDNPDALAQLREIVESYTDAPNIRDVKIELVTTNPEEVLELFRKKSVNETGKIELTPKPLEQRLIFLDISLGGYVEYSGIELAREIRTYDIQANIVFVTSNSMMFSDVIRHKITPLGYVMKPYRDAEDMSKFKAEITDLLSEARKRMVKPAIDRHPILFKSGFKEIYVNLPDIYYVRGNNDPAKKPAEITEPALALAYTTTRIIPLKRNLKYYDENIPELVRLGRSFLMNPFNVVEKETRGKYGYLTLTNGETITVMKKTLLEYEARVEKMMKDRGLPR